MTGDNSSSKSNNEESSVNWEDEKEGLRRVSRVDNEDKNC